MFDLQVYNKSQFALLKANEEPLYQFFFASLAFFILFGTIFHVFNQSYWGSRVESAKKNDKKDEVAKGYVDLKAKKKLYYMSYQVSAVHSALIVPMGLYGAFQCAPPAEHQLEGTLGNTYLVNDWCLRNGNVYEVLTLIFFAAYLVFDILVCAVLMRDFSPNMMQNYFHHLLGFFGVAGGVLCGSYVAVLASATTVLEVSTPFVNLRYLLWVHKKSDSMIYILNGLSLTLWFFVLRVVYIWWITITKIPPMMMDLDNIPMETESLKWLGVLDVCLYPILGLLNFYWFTKIASGSIDKLKEHFGFGGSSAKTTSSK